MEYHQNNDDNENNKDNNNKKKTKITDSSLRKSILGFAAGDRESEPFLRRFRHWVLITLIRLRLAARHTCKFLKWMILAVAIGSICGLTAALFHLCLDAAGRIAGTCTWTLYLLPAAGLLIVFLYRSAGIVNDEGTNSILRAARAEDTSALRVTPLIFTATFLTHLCQGSAGREGAALQIGGSLGSFISRKFRLSKYEHQMSVMCGMSACFSALLGTPLTAALFSIEVAGVGNVFYAGLVPSILASVIASMIASALGVKPMIFPSASVPSADGALFLRIILLAWIIALLSIAYCSVMHLAIRAYRRLFHNPYLRIAAGGGIVILLTTLFGTRMYNGIGMTSIEAALLGHAEPQDFILKLLLTAATLGAGYKGGEIIPSFFIGATCGCILGPLLGLDPAFAAQLALIALFCGVVNCPVSSILLSVELFGSGNFLFFGTAAAVSYMLSGYYSLYSGQKFMNAKLIPVPFERNAKK